MLKVKKIAFVIEGFALPYNYVSASVRLRVYDVIRLFEGESDFFLELYQPWRKYDIVIFLKRDAQALSLAKKLQKNGVKIVLDINANIFDKSLYGKGFFKEFGDDFFNNITEFAKIAHYILVTSPYLKSNISGIFGDKKTIFIPENIPDFSPKKQRDFSKNDGVIRLVYAGYASKADQIYLIQSSLESLAKKYFLHYILICERNPHLSIPGVQFEYIRFQEKYIRNKILQGDIFLSPRDIHNRYNLGHSFTKIGLPLSMGIPVIASPLPAYEHSPAILINTLDYQWAEEIERLFSNQEFYQNQSEKGILFCQNNFSPEIIQKKYTDFFNAIA